MERARITITIDGRTLAGIDRLVGVGIYPSRSQAIQSTLDQRIAKPQRSRLARECAHLDKAEEQALADEGYGRNLEVVA